MGLFFFIFVCFRNRILHSSAMGLCFTLGMREIVEKEARTMSTNVMLRGVFGLGYKRCDRSGAVQVNDSHTFRSANLSHTFGRYTNAVPNYWNIP